MKSHLLTIGLLCISRFCAADIIELSDRSIGDPNPTTYSAPVGTIDQNGDFFVQTCCGDTVMFNKTEEYVWTFLDLTTDDDWGNVDFDTIETATLNVSWGSGGDTPWDDEMRFHGVVVTPFGFTSNFQEYSREFNLIDLFGAEHVKTAVEAGVIQVRTSNDTFLHDVTISVIANSVTVPEPAASGLIVGLIGFILRRRREH